MAKQRKQKYYLFAYKSNWIQQIEPISSTNHIVQLLVRDMFNSAIHIPKFTTFEFKGKSKSYPMRSITKKKRTRTLTRKLFVQMVYALRKLFARRMLHYRSTNNGFKPKLKSGCVHITHTTHNPLYCGDWILLCEVLRKKWISKIFPMAKRNLFNA